MGKPVTRQEIDAQIKGMAMAVDASLKDLFGKKMGYQLLVFDYDGDATSWASNANLSDLADLMEEHAKRLRSQIALREAAAALEDKN